MHSKLCTQVRFFLGTWLESGVIPQKLKFLRIPYPVLRTHHNIMMITFPHPLAIQRHLHPRNPCRYPEDTLHRSKMALASLSSKFYIFSVLFSVKLCSPAALHSPAGPCHPPAWPSCECRKKQLESRRKVLCLLTGMWVVQNQRGKGSRDKHSFEEQH